MKDCAKILKIIAVVCLSVLLLNGCSSVNSGYFFGEETTEKRENITSDDLTVRFLDVGQADSILVTCGASSMLIDGGNVADADFVADWVTSSTEKLDYVVNTHPHEDHCGGLARVVESVEVENAVISPQTADTNCYNNFISELQAKNVNTFTAEPGMEFSVGEAVCTVIGPITSSSSDLNNASVIIRMEYADKVFLFMGDAESEEERSVIQAGYDVKCNVLKAGHHGSSTSSGYIFLREAMPDCVVVSVGAKNSYGHPDENTISRFEDAGASVYRTDVNGTVTVTVEKNGTIDYNAEKML